MIILLAFILIIVLVAAAALYNNLPKQPHQIIKQLKGKKVKLIYNDDAKKIKFCSIRHKIIARPDFIYEYPDGSLAIVEYKSRKKGVMARDITQLKAAAIAVKEEWQCRVKHGFVLTGSRQYEAVDLNKTGDTLAKEIGKYLTIAREIKSGHAPTPEPTARKCRGCNYRSNCQYAML